MGNTIGSQRLEDLRSYLLESPDIVVHSLLATYKLFKVFHCAHEGFKHGGVIVKLFIPNESEEDDHTELRIESLLKPYRDATFLVQCRFSGLIHPNVVPYESAEVLHNSGILVRQFFGRNLYDRMYSQPHLTHIHKVWIALQGLCSVAQLHSVGIIHGDIKNENFFLIGSFQAVLTDLSTFIKPVFLPLNDPVAATTLFFESGGSKRRRCFIAPERFIDSLTSRVLDEHGRRMTFFDKEFTQDFVRMDLFSLGLSIAELFLDGQHVIDLPELLAFRNGASLENSFSKIPEILIRDLVTNLVQLDPLNRPESATACIVELLEILPFAFKGLLIPLLALIGHPVYASADMRMLLFRQNWKYISKLIGVSSTKIDSIDRFTELDLFEQCQSASLLTRGVNASVPPLTAWSDQEFPHAILNEQNCTNFTQKIVALWAQGSAVHSKKTGADSWRTNEMPSLINQLYNVLWERDDALEEQLMGDPSILPILCSLLGSTALASNATKSKLVYIQMVYDLMTDSESIPSYILPYLHDLALPAQPDSVRESAMDCLAELVEKLPQAETGLFSEYLFPLCLLADTPDPGHVLRLAVALTRSALRLLKEDKNTKKLIAIRLFAQRVIQRFSTTLSNLELVTFMDPVMASTVLVDMLTKSATTIEFAIHVPAACALINIESGRPVIDSGTVESLIIPFLLETLASPALADNHACCVIRALGDLVTGKSKATLKSVVDSILKITKTSSIVAQSAQYILSTVIGQTVPVVDQFVFLRTIISSRTLVDLKIELPETLFNSNATYFSQGIADLDGLTGGHIVNVAVVNSHYASPSSMPRKNPLRLANYKDFRTEAAGLPRPLPDVGCLTGLDGSFSSIYEDNDEGPVSLQRKYLNTLPCVPVKEEEGTPLAVGSILLATLTDFCSSGFAVPVVAVDSTDDGRLIVGAGADGTLRIWRTAALETDAVICASRTLSVAKRLNTVRTIRNSKSAVVGADDNRLRMLRLDGEGFLGQSDSHRFGTPLKLECFDTDFASCVFAVCDKGGVINWDIRTNHFAFQMSGVGPLSGLVLSKDAHRFAVSTYSAQLVMYDQRFLKPMHQWTHSSGPISGLAHSGKSGFSAWVSTANEVCLFDMESGESQQILSTVGPNGLVGEVPRLTTTQTSFDPTTVAQLVKSDAAARAVIECATNKDWTLFTGHNDGIVRYWQPDNAGIAFPAQFEVFTTVYNPNHMIQRIIKERDSHALDETTYHCCKVTEGHRDAINDMCLASMQYDIFVTAGRDGLVKLWK